MDEDGRILTRVDATGRELVGQWLDDRLMTSRREWDGSGQEKTRMNESGKTGMRMRRG